MGWIYFATSEKASLASTLEVVLNEHFLWRSVFNSNGSRIANVANLQVGDPILVAWRHSAGVRSAYLLGTIAEPRLPVVQGMVIDTVRGPDAEKVVAAGYRPNADGEVEGIRLENVWECCFEIRGEYGGNKAIHRLVDADADAVSTASCIPPESLRMSSLSPSATFTAAVVIPSGVVDVVQVEAKTEDRAFDAYVMVDWSSSSSPVTGNDSIWVASGAWSGRTFTAESPTNYPTRAQAVLAIEQQLGVWREDGKRVLVGLDFSFGYPARFAEKLGLAFDSRAAWKALHEFIAANVSDSPRNEHNRDSFAEECNRRVGAPGPFWGCAAGSATAALTQQRVGVFAFPHHGLQEWRATELAAKRRVPTQSVWKLNCGVSVGGQTILGIKHLHELALAVGGHRWPFEGWGTPTHHPAVWFAEIFPSLVQYPEWSEEYQVRRDRTQVQSCVRRAAERDAVGLLRGDFAKPDTLDAATLAKVEEEEGWILWV
jgi:hypothetical protein